MNKLTILLLLTGSAGFSQSIAGGINSASIVSNGYSSGVGVIYVVPANPDRVSSGTLGAATQIVFEALGTGDYIEAEGITYHPNPVQDYLTFTIPHDVSLATMQVFDAKGTQVKLAPVNGNKLDLTALSAGIYFISFPNTKIKPIKIVKK
ncbi:T9SS type A sorting domain-containing protein [uncultured Flavobacterium sp.]|uniref:T9SS type A sorting domain-containing protein n=1 Tax=uncultured Flavobacterium sp. TaxID=165435 RepID=UPI0025E53F0A|nr:T9SS type A sorting domain-containing protein [uncultured Flavobacterium sp.]